MSTMYRIMRRYASSTSSTSSHSHNNNTNIRTTQRFIAPLSKHTPTHQQHQNQHQHQHPHSTSHNNKKSFTPPPFMPFPFPSPSPLSPPLPHSPSTPHTRSPNEPLRPFPFGVSPSSPSPSAYPSAKFPFSVSNKLDLNPNRSPASPFSPPPLHFVPSPSSKSAESAVALIINGIKQSAVHPPPLSSPSIPISNRQHNNNRRPPYPSNIADKRLKNADFLFDPSLSHSSTGSAHSHRHNKHINMNNTHKQGNSNKAFNASGSPSSTLSPSRRPSSPSPPSFVESSVRGGWSGKVKRLVKREKRKGNVYKDNEEEEEGVSLASRRIDMGEAEEDVPSSSLSPSPSSEILVFNEEPLVFLSSRLNVDPLDLLSSIQVIYPKIQSINTTIKRDLAELMAAEHGRVPIRTEMSYKEYRSRGRSASSAALSAPPALLPRPPIVCVMGHVDHGKTSLLDYLREENRAAREAGGITQNIGSFRVDIEGRESTFLDTPGHAAFRSLRVLGASHSLSDMIILVISAVDGIQPQTVEVIKLAAGNNIPLIVAMNKCDLPGANSGRIKKELLGWGVATEDMGGEVLSVDISAKTGEGMDKLKEAIGLVGDVLELRAPVDCNGEGILIQSTIDRQRGFISSVILQRGTLETGDLVVSGQQMGKIKWMRDEKGQDIDSLVPGDSAEICLSFPSMEGTVPLLQQIDNEEVGQMLIAKNREISETNQLELDKIKEEEAKRVEKRERRQQETEMEDVAESPPPPSSPPLPIINFLIRCDNAGSLSAINDYFNLLSPLCTSIVQLNVADVRVGDISAADVENARMMRAKLIAFNIPTKAASRAKSSLSGVLFETDIIYKLMDFVRDEISAKIPPLSSVRTVGEGKIKQIIPLSGDKRSEILMAAGIEVTSGEIKNKQTKRNMSKKDGNMNRDNKIGADYSYSIYRVEECIWTGKALSLRHLKDEVFVLSKGSEGGIVFDEEGGANAVKFDQGDRIICTETISETVLFDDGKARVGHSQPEDMVDYTEKDKEKSKKKDKKNKKWG